MNEKQPWKVGGSNDEQHHWFIFRYLDEDGGDYEIRNVDGEGVPRRSGGYVVYRTKRDAFAALRDLKASA